MDQGMLEVVEQSRLARRTAKELRRVALQLRSEMLERRIERAAARAQDKEEREALRLQPA
jgi:hypothetical protein